MYPVTDEKRDLRITKRIDLVFSTAMLAEHHEKIATDLTKVIRTVAQERELLRNDSAARGYLIERVYTSSWWSSTDDDNGKWNHSYYKLKQDYDPQHPDEYWGTALSTGDIIAGSTTPANVLGSIKPSESR